MAAGGNITLMLCQQPGQKSSMDFWGVAVVDGEVGGAEGLDESADQVEDSGFIF